MRDRVKYTQFVVSLAENGFILKANESIDRGASCDTYIFTNSADLADFIAEESTFE